MYIFITDGKTLQIFTKSNHNFHRNQYKKQKSYENTEMTILLRLGQHTHLTTSGQCISAEASYKLQY